MTVIHAQPRKRKWNNPCGGCGRQMAKDEHVISQHGKRWCPTCQEEGKVAPAVSFVEQPLERPEPNTSDPQTEAQKEAEAEAEAVTKAKAKKAAGK